MLLDLSEIVVRQGMRVDVVVDQPAVEDPDLVFLAPIKGRLTFEHGGDILRITGPVHAELGLSCSRCLQETGFPVDLQVAECFPIAEVMHPDRPSGEEGGWETLVGSVIHLDQGRPILDLDELLRQLLVAELPIRVLCREDCAGLCPTCGGNRNERTCTCETSAANRPLAGLGRLLEETVLSD